MTKIISILGITLAVIGAISFVSPSHAQLDAATRNLDTTLTGSGLVGGSEQSLGQLIGAVVRAVLALVGTVFLLLTIYAGILWMTASGNEDQVGKAQKIITTTVIGLFITMGAYAITFFVTNRLSKVGEGKPQITTPKVPTKCGEQDTMCFSLKSPDFNTYCELSYGQLDCAMGESCCKERPQ